MNKLLKNIITPVVIITGLNLFPSPTPAEVVEGGSVLCYNRNLETKIAVSINRFNAAICSTRDNREHYYVGQSKNSNEKVFVSAQEIYMNGGKKFKAINGSYSYQIVATCNPNRRYNDSVTVSVFQKGKKIANHRTNRYMTSVPWC